MSRSAKDGARAGRSRTRAGITIAVATLGLAALPAAASAAFVEPPQLPHIPTVFPDRDFVSADGYANNKDMRITVLRNGVKIGEATGTTDNAGLLEVNHPGGVCWTGTTPNIIAGDKVVIAEAGAPADVGDAVTVSDVTAEAAVKELNALGQPTGRVIVRGRALNADGTAMDLGSVEQRVVNPDLKNTVVNKRDVRAVVGEGLTPDPAGGVGAFIAVYDQYPDDVDDLIVNGQTRVLTWQGVTPGGDRLGITIHEVGEVGGPGFGGCPGGSNYGVTGANHLAVTKALKDAGSALLVSGVSLDATAIDVTLSDGVHSETAVGTPDANTGPQAWTAEFTAAQLANLSDGTLTASGSYTVGANPPIAGTTRTFVKDTVAPGAPDATPGGGTFDAPQAVTLFSPDPTAAIHFTANGSTPSALSVRAPAQLSITSSQTIKAIAVDGVGNSSDVATFGYTIAPRLAGGGAGLAQVIPVTTASQGVQGAVARSLAVSRLSLARRISITRLRVQGLRASMTVPRGASVVRVAVYKARNGKKTGRALAVSTGTARAGLHRVTLRNAALLRKLKTGAYVLEAQTGQSESSLGTAARMTFTVTR